MWDLIVSVPDHCLSFYLSSKRHLSETLEYLQQTVSRSTKFLFTSQNLTIQVLYSKVPYIHKACIITCTYMPNIIPKVPRETKNHIL